MITETQKNVIIEVLLPFSPKQIGIFGSYARSESDKNSDLDILVEFTSTVNLLEIIGLEIELSDALNLKVDLVTNKSLTAELEPFVLKDLKQIFHA